MRDDIDLCWRVWLAGHRVVVVPEAVVYHAEASARERREIHIASGRVHLLDRAGAMRILLANLPTRRFVFAVPRLLIGGLLRAFGYLVAKIPRHAADEVLAIGDVLLHPQAILHDAPRAPRRPPGRTRVTAPPLPGLRPSVRARPGRAGLLRRRPPQRGHRHRLAPGRGVRARWGRGGEPRPRRGRGPDAPRAAQPRLVAGAGPDGAHAARRPRTARRRTPAGRRPAARTRRRLGPVVGLHRVLAPGRRRKFRRVPALPRRRRVRGHPAGRARRPRRHRAAARQRAVGRCDRLPRLGLAARDAGDAGLGRRGVRPGSRVQRRDRRRPARDRRRRGAAPCARAGRGARDRYPGPGGHDARRPGSRHSR